MEEDIRTERKNTLSLHKNKLVQERLSEAIDKAQEILNYEAAHNTEIIEALHIVKKFIQTQKRICYGGTAMNALLPKKDKFYDPDYDLPDYDFLTPDGEKDLDELLHMFKGAGYTNVHNKIGIHDGTMKLLVNYYPVADITMIHKNIYDVLIKESKAIDGIHYANEHVLRMMMFLELSRPRGEIERWKKVFERLELINKHFKFKKCTKKHHKKNVPLEIREKILNFLVTQQRVLVNLDLESIYKYSLTHKDVSYKVLPKGGPMFFYSPDIKKDALYLKEMLDIKSLKLMYYKDKDDYLPSRIRIVYDGIEIAILIHEDSCNSYNNVPTLKNKVLRIATLETIIHLFYSFYFFTNGGSEKPYLCDIGKCVDLFYDIAESKTSIFKPFSVSCSGYQKGYPTLLHEKIERIKKKKNSTLKKK